MTLPDDWYESMFLSGVGWYDPKHNRISDYGKTIMAEPWEVMPKWKKWAIYIFIILFLLLWGYLAIKGISEQGLHLEKLCIVSCDGK